MLRTRVLISDKDEHLLLLPQAPRVGDRLVLDIPTGEQDETLNIEYFTVLEVLWTPYFKNYDIVLRTVRYV